VYSLVNTNSVRTLVRELLQFLVNSDVEFRADLAAKICLVTEKFAPNKKWHIDTILRVLSIAGEYVNDDVIASLIALVTQNEDLHAYAVQKMYLALKKDIIKQPLVQASIWCIGEYGDILLSGVASEKDEENSGEVAALSVKEDDIFALFESVDKHASTNIVTREFLLTATVKLVDRLKSPSFQAKAEQFLEHFTNDYHLELHERSSEYFNVLKMLESPQVRSKVIGPVPPFPVKKEMAASSTPAVDSPAATKAPAAEKKQAAAPVEAPKPAPTTSILDDLELLTTPAPGAAAPAGGDLMASLFGGAPAPVPSAGGGLADLLSLAPAPSPVAAGPFSTPTAGYPAPTSGYPAPSIPSAAPAPAFAAIAPIAAAPGAYPDIVAFTKDGITINFSFQKNPQNAAHTLINVSLVNLRPNPCSEVAFQISVPKYIKFQVGAASAKDLLPNGQNKILIPVKLNNTEHGQRPILMKIRLEFTCMGQKSVEVADINNLPPGL
jgi:AP-1 complex subunit gamma-1